MLNKAIIDLNAIRQNALSVKKLLPEKTKFCAVVKADAYGHGAEKVANALYPIADCFSVALVEEAVALRLSGIDKVILVLNRPICKADAETIARYDLTATVYKTNDLIMLNEAASNYNTVVRVHVKINTGMNRQGVDGIEELERILETIDNCKCVAISGVYTHYACPENDSARKKATDKFLLANNLVKRYNNNVIAHASASGGMLKGEFFDMVRIGILLYGYKPFDTDRISVIPAMRIYAPVLGERSIKAGETALYGIKPAQKSENLSLIRYGYADGLPRTETDGLFNNRCMDVSAYIGVSRGTKFINVLSDAELLAESYGTISYEILTKAAIRAEKIYIN